MGFRAITVSVAATAAAVVTGLTVAAVASPAAPPAPSPQHPPAHRDAVLVGAFEQVDQNTPWTLDRTIPQTWLPAGASWEQEGLKAAGGRIYISVFDKTDDEGRLVVLDANGTLVRDIALPDGVRDHAGGIDVAGDAVYVPVAEDHAHSSADIYRVDTRTFAVRKLFTVARDHVGGVTYDPVKRVLVGQDWDSRTFYEWTLSGRQVATWRNPNDYVGYQDCQYVPFEKLLCSASPLGAQKLPAFDLIDLADPDHALLNGVPLPQGRAGNANEILTRPAAGGATTLLDVDASPGPIEIYRATVG